MEEPADQPMDPCMELVDDMYILIDDLMGTPLSGSQAVAIVVN